MHRFTLMVSSLAVLAGALALGGCQGESAEAPPRQFLPDLDDQLKFKPQSESGFYADGRAQRTPPANTVAFGRMPHTQDITGFTRTGRAVSVDFAERAKMLKADDAFYRGLDAQGAFLADIPVAVTEDLITLGRENFNIYCIVCHGGLGEGDGPVGQRWAYAIPSFQDPAIFKGGSADKGSDGFIYDIIRNGVANPGGPFPLKMPAYATKVDEYESWAIVAYIRTLQAAQSGTIQDLPERLQIKLQSSASADTPGNNAVTHANDTPSDTVFGEVPS
ncbi:cytochrome c [Planctomycetaceae bacterium AH-315-I19]|nr:cytochrome c [Planctomycetaceae bacterium AH-315-I19]